VSEDALAKLASTPLVVRRGPYALGAWAPAQASAVGAALLRRSGDLLLWMRDDREVSALCRDEALGALPPPREVQRGWAVLTLDQAMAWDLTGVLAAVSGALAAAGIPLGALTAYSRDHVLVSGERLDDALAALRPLCGEVRFVD
jgi:hypothetical protein